MLRSGEVRAEVAAQEQLAEIDIAHAEQVTRGTVVTGGHRVAMVRREEHTTDTDADVAAIVLEHLHARVEAES